MKTVTLYEAAMLLLRADEYLILPHARPDADAMGSAEALRALLTALGKKACVFCADEAPAQTAFLRKGLPPGAYLSAGDGPEFFSGKTIVTIDTAQLHLLGSAAPMAENNVYLKIDHHASGDDFARYNYVDPAAAAAGEIVWELAQMLECVNETIARAVYTAIAGDTGCFRYGNTSAGTHEIAAQAARMGADLSQINEELYENRDPAEVRALAFGLSGAEFLFNGQAAILLLTARQMQAVGCTDRHFAGVSSELRAIRGVEASFVLTQDEEDPKKFRISARSKRRFNCSAFCRLFSGGGHLRAAGGEILAETPEKAKAMLKEKLEEVWNNGQ